jgi:hypothetical protein
MAYESGLGFRFYEEGEEKGLTGSGLSEASHNLLDSLKHLIAENCRQRPTRVDGRITNITYWTDSDEDTKVREFIIARTGGKVSQIDVIQYDESGVEKVRITGTIVRVGGRVDYIDWVETIA